MEAGQGEAEVKGKVKALAAWMILQESLELKQLLRVGPHQVEMVSTGHGRHLQVGGFLEPMPVPVMKAVCQPHS